MALLTSSGKPLLLSGNFIIMNRPEAGNNNNDNNPVVAYQQMAKDCPKQTYLRPSLVRCERFPIDSGISSNSLCCRSSELICTQFPISEIQTATSVQHPTMLSHPSLVLHVREANLNSHFTQILDYIHTAFHTLLIASTGTVIILGLTITSLCFYFLSM